MDFEQTISNFKQDIQEISNEIEMLKEELSQTKFKEYEMKSGTQGSNKKAPCNDSAMITSTNIVSKASYSSEYSNVTKDGEEGLESFILHDLKNSKRNININNPKYLSISENVISLDENIPRKCFWDRSQTSINLIKNLSRELQDDSLNNLLLNSERSIQNINNLIRNKSYSDSLVIRELFEALTRKKVTSRICKEVEMRSQSLEAEESKATISSGILEVKENDNLEEECSERASDIGSDISYKNQSDYFAEKPYYTPTSITVQEVTDMLFSLSNTLEKIPDSLKHSKMLDLNPPKSMKTAISLLAHLSKSIDIVQLSRSFSFDDTDELTETNQNTCNLERKMGQYSMHCTNKYRVGFTK